MPTAERGGPPPFPAASALPQTFSKLFERVKIIPFQSGVNI